MYQPQKIRTFIWLIALCVGLGFASTASADTFGHSHQEIEYTWYSTSGGSTVSLSDDSYATVNIGFPFAFYGQTYTQLAIGSNGYLQFGNGDRTDYSPDAIASTNPPNNYIAPWWDDLNPSNGGTIRYRTTGSAGQRRFTAEWNNVRLYGSTQVATVQATLFESSNYIVLSINNSPVGYTHTIGIEGPGGTDGQRIYWGSASHSQQSWLIRAPIVNNSSGTGNCGSDDTYVCNSANYTFNTISDEVIPPTGSYSLSTAGYTWYTPSSRTTVSLSDDDTELVNLPFSFSYYGNNYTQAYINSNGSVSFGSGYAYPYSTSGNNIPSTLTPNNMIAGLFIDLDPRVSSGVTYGSMSIGGVPAFVVSYDNIPMYYYGTSNGSARFQIIMFNNGTIRVNINYLTNGPSARPSWATYYLVGIENSSGSSGLRALYGSGNLSNRSYIFTPNGAPSAGSGILWSGPTSYNLFGCDDARKSVSLPFSFQYYNNTYNTLWVGTNGLAGFTRYASCDNSFCGLNDYWPDPIPTTAIPNNFLAPTWADFNACLGGQIMYAVRGSAPNRQVVVEWNGMQNYWDNSKISTVQMILHEGSQRIDYNLQTVRNPTAPTYEVGIENSAGNGGIRIASGSANITSTSYRITRAQTCDPAALGQSCTYGAEQGTCRTGITTCYNGGVQCSQHNWPLTEVCNNADDNCNGTTDDVADALRTTFYRDADSDGRGNPNNTTRACFRPSGFVTNTNDCNDGDSSTYRNAPELCDLVDNSCDCAANGTYVGTGAGVAQCGCINGQGAGCNEGVPTTTYYWDNDNDTYGGTSSINLCSLNLLPPPIRARYRTQGGDCNDSDSSINPGASEICDDGDDEDCDNQIDEGFNRNWYLDSDGDTFGGSLRTLSCARPPNHVRSNNDCNDGYALTYPGAPEICDGADNNCNNSIDENNPLREEHPDYNPSNPASPQYQTFPPTCFTGQAGECSGSGVSQCAVDGVGGQVLCNVPDVAGFGNTSQVTIPDGLLDRDDAEVGGTNYKLITSNGRYLFNLAYKGTTGYNGYKIRVFDPEDGFSLVKEFDVGTVSYYIDGISARGNVLYAVQWSGSNGARVIEIDWVNEQLIGTRTHNQGSTQAIEGQYDWVNDVFWLGALRYGARVYQYNGEISSAALDDSKTFTIRGTINSGAGTIASDGRFLYVKRWGGSYPGTDDLRRIGTGYGGTVAGWDYGSLGNVWTTLSTTYHSDGYVYIAGTSGNQLQRVRVTEDRIEVCDNVDNNCDGVIDHVAGAAIERDCSTDCEPGVEVCQAGSWLACTAQQPTPEVCDGQDNDCDGEVDGLAASLTCDRGCGPYRRLCVGGVLEECMARAPEPEICDEIDNDCDLEVDEPLDEVCGCIYQPVSGDPIAPSLEWMWSASSTTIHPVYDEVMMTPVVANLTDDNGDGLINEDDIPEVAFVTTTTAYKLGGYLRVVDGGTGQERWVYTGNKVTGASSPAIADLDNDGTPEVLAYGWRNRDEGSTSNAGLIALDHNGNELWINEDVNSANIRQMGSPTVADILPGRPGFEIAACHWLVGADGQTIWGNVPTSLNNNCTPAVADLDPNSPGLEIVVGGRAYRADGQIMWANAEVLDLWGNYDGAPAIADLDGDGRPEVILVRKEILVLDALTGVLVASIDPADPSVGVDSDWGSGGAPNVDDFDGDGLPEIGTAGGNKYAVFKLVPEGVGARLDVLWDSPTVDNSSKVTGSSVFDFNGDGRAEVVYNDEYYLRIYDGVDGTVIFEEANGSGTLVEYPVVVDADNDGNAEILVGRNTIGSNCTAECEGPLAGLRMLGDPNDNWVNTRGIWNQYAYHVTNIRDDSSVPSPEPNSWTANNSYRSNYQGFGDRFAAPDLVIDSVGPIEYGPDAGNWPGTSVPYCPAWAQVDVTVCNQGDAPVLPGLVIKLYLGDPENGGTEVATGVTQGRLEFEAPNNCEDVTIGFASDVEGTFTLYAKVDADSVQNECVEDNNAFEVGPVTLQTHPDEELFCDNVDDDCNAAIDDDLYRDCPECPGRDQECSAGVWLNCVSGEVCDGFDNDCNGMTDESPATCGQGAACSCSNGTCGCVETLTVTDNCSPGCPLGTVCNAELECEPYCEFDHACPNGQVCNSENVCVDAGEVEQPASFKEAFQDPEEASEGSGGCSVGPLSDEGVGGLGALLLFAAGLLIFRRR